MNDIESIINESNSSVEKQDWIKKKEQEKDKVYSLIEKTLTESMNDPQKFREYLDVQSRFDKYSVANAYLIAAQMPNATQLRELKEWKDKNIEVNKNSEILLLKKGKTYTRKDGSTFSPNIVYKMYDVSQTNLSLKNHQTKKLDDKMLLKAFLHNSPVDIKIEDNLDKDKLVKWDSEKNILFIKRGSISPNFLQELVKEFVRIDSENDNKVIESFRVECASYMICKKYGIDTSNYELSNVPNCIKNLKTHDIRKELEVIRESTNSFNNRVTDYVISISKKNKQLER